MFVRPNPAPHHFQKDRGEIESSALEQRGWTVQESILPLRMLHFTGNEMAWECNQMMLCECGLMKFNAENGTIRYLKTSFMKERKSGRATVQSIDGWRRIVTEYSGRMLTQEGDKLIAISGLTQKIMESISFPDEGTAPYLGGLWR
jgi:hypothetical protein